MRVRRLIAGLVALVAASAALVGLAGASEGADLQPPIRASFVYQWFDENFHATDRYPPELGQYDSGNRAVIAAQLAGMKYAGLQAAITSWWGQGQKSEQTRFPRLLAAAKGAGMQVTPYYERECCDTDPSVAEIQSDLTYLRAYRDTYPDSFLSVAGKPVIFVYNAGATGCSDVSKWKQATNDWADWYVNMKVFSGYSTCPDQPSSWHQYGPATARSQHGSHHVNVSPGFWHYNEPDPRLPRDLDRFKCDISYQADAQVMWKLITSWNEIGEGTNVEPSAAFQSASGWGDYLDALRAVYVDGQRFPCASPSPSPSATPSPTPDPTPDPTPTPEPTPSPSSTPPSGSAVVWAGGDICDDDNAVPGCEATAAMVQADQSSESVLALGDLAYESGCPSEFTTWYNPRWGPIKAKTRPAPGNHEYICSPGTAAGYFGYWGAQAGTAGQGWHSYSPPGSGWRLLALNSNCSKVGGCGSTNPQGVWLAQQLAEAKAAGECVLGFAHHPAYTDNTSYSPGTSSGKALFDRLYDGDAELYVTGHAHIAERFKPLNKSGVVDTARGVVQFVDGTGGKGLTTLGTRRAISEFGQDDKFGLARFVLSPGAWSYQFVAIDGQVMDSASGTCH